MSNFGDPMAFLMDYKNEKNLLRNLKTFKLLFVQFLIIGLFANNLLPQTCFCGEACLHGLQGKTKASLSFIFHPRCSGTQCKSCNFEDLQTLKALSVTHSAEKLNTLDTSFILSNFSDYQFNVNFIKILFSRPNKYVKIQSPPTYLQNLSLLL
jgi:hypothetical protein